MVHAVFFKHTELSPKLLHWPPFVPVVLCMKSLSWVKLLGYLNTDLHYHEGSRKYSRKLYMKPHEKQLHDGKEFKILSIFWKLSFKK